MKIEKFNIAFFCEKGNWSVKEATEFPTLERVNETAECLEELGLGRIKKIVIDII
ncbi:hypothetical protein SAMN04487851_114122 [Prevotella sp. tc2-28]|uniref:hypothetical protein n=1 Tax=Prevotella sp. tc2-28 TaxID=1761888 RepID=UPI00089BDD71|nr:hypothetical protein [Prevotella sp. tc2-28]SEA81168.1 hypothetical protein SAMN04487851_114122 [Prevotella sp. tc2-28]